MKTFILLIFLTVFGYAKDAEFIGSFTLEAMHQRQRHDKSLMDSDLKLDQAKQSSQGGCSRVAQSLRSYEQDFWVQMTRLSYGYFGEPKNDYFREYEQTREFKRDVNFSRRTFLAYMLPISIVWFSLLTSFLYILA